MNTRTKPILNAADLGREAEAWLGGEPAGGSQLVHELQVHQLELEMRCRALADQNAELLHWRAEAERARRELIAADENRGLDLRLQEDVLGASEEKFARIFRLSPDAINLTGLDDGIIYEANQSFAKLYGYTTDEVIGNSTLPGGLGTWVSREDRDRFIARLKAEGELLDFEVPLRRKDGTLFAGLISSALLEIAGQRYNLSIVRDITRAKQAEEALRHERTFARALLDNLVEGVVACDEQGELVLFNRTLRQWQGLDAQNLPQDQWASHYGLFEPEGTTPMAAQAIPLVRAFNGEVIQGAGMVIRAPGQPPRQILANGTPIFDDAGRRLGAVVVMHDVTRQRRIDGIVRKISVAVEQSPVTIVITDTEGRIEYVNPKFTELTGYSGPEALGQNPRILKSGEMPAEAYAALWATIAAGEIWKGEFHNRKKNGELFWEAATIAPIKDPTGAITNYVAIKEDITGRKLTAQMLQQLNEDLEDRIRGRTALLEVANAELDAFSYSVSHDLRAPLRGIDGFSQALMEECGDQLNDTARHYLGRVRAGTQRMGQLIDDLLKLSRVSRTSLNRQRLDLSAMAGTILEELGTGDPGRTVDVRVEPGLIASGDRGLVRSVLENLLGNAWKYSAKLPVARIELFREVRTGSLEAFCVRDNGAGFDMAYAGKLFSAFQRLHSAHDFPGVGIGLAIVQRIVRRHGGQVWATGAVDQGATFSFTLPELP